MGVPCSKQQEKKKQQLEVTDNQINQYNSSQRIPAETRAFNNNQQPQLEQEDNEQLNESQEIRSKKQTLIDVAEDSIKIAKNRCDSFEKQSKIILSSNRKERYTVQVIDSVFDQQSSFRQRIISTYQQDKSDQLVLDNDDSQPVSVFTPRNTQKKCEISANHFSLLHQKVPQFYFKIVSDIQTMLESQEQLKEKARYSNEVLLSKIQITDNYLNNYAFFNILREGFKQVGTNLILVAKVPTVDSFTSNISYFLSNQSYYYYQLTFQIIGSFNYEDIKHGQQPYLQQMEKIIRIILTQERIDTQIIWLLCRNVKRKYVEILFTLPSLQDTKKELVKQKFLSAFKTEYKNFIDAKVESLMKYLEVSFDLVDPWKSCQKQGWKFFFLNDSSEQVEQENISSGFINLFYQSASSRQHDQESGVYIVKSLQQLDLDLIPEFMRPKEIEIKVYGEEKTYQVALKIEYDVSQARQVQQGILHTGEQVKVVAIVIRQI